MRCRRIRRCWPAPRSAGHRLAVAEAAVRGPLQIAGGLRWTGLRLLADARPIAPGGAIVVGGEVDSSERLVGRGRVAGADAAYVCRGRVCDLPVTSAAELESASARDDVGRKRPDVGPRPLAAMRPGSPTR